MTNPLSTAPFMLAAVKSGQQALYSILPTIVLTTTSTKNVNITPITTLIMYNLNGGVDPATMYRTRSFATLTAATVNTKAELVRTELTTLASSASAMSPVFDILYGSFTATGASDNTGYDTTMDQLGSITSLSPSGVTFTNSSGTSVQYAPSSSDTTTTVTSTKQTITGVVASGKPIAGATVLIKDSSSNIANGSTATDGTFSINVTGMSCPCMLVAEKTGRQNLYSVFPAVMDTTTTNTKTVNITPVTTLVMYDLNGGSDPATMYNNVLYTALTSAAVSAKESIVRTELLALASSASAMSPVFDILYGSFTATGTSDNTGYDTMLDQLGSITSLSPTGIIFTTTGGTTTKYSPSLADVSTTVVTATQTITGTAAANAPLSGATISIKDSNGNIATGTTLTDGTFSVNVTGMTPPFMLVAIRAGQQNLYSLLPSMTMVGNSTKHVNLTTITTLVMYELNGGSDPATLYNNTSYTAITDSSVSIQEGIVRNELTGLASSFSGVNPVFDLMYGTFTATGTSDSTGYDVVLEQLGNITSISSAGVDFSNLLTPYTYSTGTALTQTIVGTVASGTAVAGATVSLKDSKGALTTGTSAANGTFSLNVTGMTPPFMLAAVKAGRQNLYSVLTAMDMTTTHTLTVNITPITTLVLYELNSGVDPSSMYNTLSYTSLAAGMISAKQGIVRSKLANLGSAALSAALNSVNPIFDMMYGQFTAAGIADSTGYDTALDQLGSITATSTTGVSFTNTNGTLLYTSSSGSGGTGTTTTPTITVVLRNVANTANVSSIDTSTPALVQATVRDASGSGVANAIVTFSTNAIYAAFSGGANTALTDANGIAQVELTTSNTSGGASTVTANATVAGVAISGSINYAVGSSTIALGPMTFGVGAGTLSAYGTTSVSVSVLNNGNLYTLPMVVNFTSTCASTGKATLTASVTTLNGVATASYLDNGCNNATPGDTVTATLTNGGSVTGSLPVGTPTLGSIQYVSVVTTPATTPPTITLKGTGGNGRSETAKVTFRVVDSAGNPVGGKTVSFSLNTAQGGLALGSTSGISDPTTGNVVTTVIAGTVSTAVRVTAIIYDKDGVTPLLSSQSDQLIISTGIPSQDEISLPTTKHNIEGWAYDGEQTTLTAMLADHFRNPVPDGTAVYFTSEGGSVLPSCTTVSGNCTTTFTSQNLRPTNGRITVLARAIGEEAFTDGANGFPANGTCDGTTARPLVNSEMIDANGISTDMPEAFVDYNENGIRDANDPYFDFNGNGQYDGPLVDTDGTTYSYNLGDGYYNGILCTLLGTGICGPTGTPRTIDVRASNVIVLSTSHAIITITGNAQGGSLIDLPPCTAAGPGAPIAFTVTVVDDHGNAMPVGTQVSFSATDGTVLTPTYTVADTAACRIGAANCDCQVATTRVSVTTGCPAGDTLLANGEECCPTASVVDCCPSSVVYPNAPTRVPGMSGFTLPGSTAFGDISVSMKSDDTYSATSVPQCTVVNGESGSFIVTVTTPKGNVTQAALSVVEQ